MILLNGALNISLEEAARMGFDREEYINELEMAGFDERDIREIIIDLGKTGIKLWGP